MFISGGFVVSSYCYKKEARVRTNLDCIAGIVMTQKGREQHLKKNGDTKKDIEKTVGQPSRRSKEKSEKVMQSQTLQRILEIKAETSEVEHEFTRTQVEFVSPVD